MGGFFQAQQPQAVSPFPAEIRPFLNQYAQAVSGLFGNAPGISEDETGVLQGIFGGAQPAQNVLGQTISGAFLPGGGIENPFLSSLRGGLEREGDIARRQLGSAAQRAGALSSTDYLRQASDLEANLAERRGGLLSGLYNQERERQLGAIGQSMGLGQFLLGAAGLPRNVYTEQFRYPFEVGGGLLGGARGPIAPGQPSPFASLLSGLAPFASLFIR